MAHILYLQDFRCAGCGWNFRDFVDKGWHTCLLCVSSLDFFGLSASSAYPRCLVQEHKHQSRQDSLRDMADYPGEVEAPPQLWPPKHELVAKWDAHPVIRDHLRTAHSLLLWQGPKAVGVANKQSLRLNRHAIQILMQVWLEHVDSPKSPPIGWLRQEVLP